jgi:hypothetical protein
VIISLFLLSFDRQVETQMHQNDLLKEALTKWRIRRRAVFWMLASCARSGAIPGKTVNRMIAPDRQGALLAGQKAGRNAVCLTVVKGNMGLMSGSITENWSFNGERNLLLPLQNPTPGADKTSEKQTEMRRRQFTPVERGWCQIKSSLL